MRKLAALLLFIGCSCLCPLPLSATTWYVSSSTGNDSNNGTSEATAFRTVGKVNSLVLQPGDRVLFRAGDTWRGEQLVLSESGTEAQPITFGAFPAGAAAKPILSGAQPVEGWTVHSGNIYVTTLSPTVFPSGLNQLFRNDERLAMGRWPNLDGGNGGFTFVDTHAANGNQFTDTALPAVDWTGAIIHLKNIRWSMIDRQVTATSGSTLTFNLPFSCLIAGWSDCVGWGYFINNHLATLDRDGEWYYDASRRRVYLYSTSGTPTGIEGSVVLEEATTLRHGGLMVSDGAPTAWNVVENLELRRWFNHGIGSPGGMSGEIYHHLTFRDLIIRDVDGAGVNLSSWLERPANGRKGLRGGHHLTFSSNTIEGANQFGITGYFAESTFSGNTIRNIALIANLNKAGMGCGITVGECTENGDGFRIRCFDPLDSGFGNTIYGNRFEEIGYNGIDIFGPNNTLERNVILRACVSKADCGGVRTFGGDDLASSQVFNVRLIDNLIIDIPGNVDGCHASRAAFGMGLYIDHYSRDVECRGNTIIDTSITGINYGRSTGQILNNTIYNASYGTEFAAHISLGSESRASVSGNILFGLGSRAWTLYARDLTNFIASDNNTIFHPYLSQHIAYGPSWTRHTFASWKTFSGLEAHSKTNWFTQAVGTPPLSRILYNDSADPKTIPLGNRQYLDLDQNPVASPLTLAPFRSRILIDNGTALTVTTPNGGEAWRRGETRAITWTANSITGNVVIELLQNGNVVGVIATVPAAQGSFNWTVGNYQGGSVASGTTYRIRVRAPAGITVTEVRL